MRRKRLSKIKTLKDIAALYSTTFQFINFFMSLPGQILSMHISKFELLIVLFFLVLLFYFIFKGFSFSQSLVKGLNSGAIGLGSNYVNSAISTWHRMQGKAENINIIYVPPFAGSPSRGKYYVSASAVYEYKNIQYICEASPYSLWYTESKEHAVYLKGQLEANNTVEIYVDRNEPAKSIFIFAGLRSWSEIKKSKSAINV